MQPDKPIKKIRLLQRDVGKWCLVHYDDIGTVQGLIVAIYDDGDFDIFVPSDSTLCRLSRDQLVFVGPKVQASRIQIG